ncbi:MAG: TetR/AcrR family transcriptional regulator [Methyloligella sp. ZOD6]
MTADKAGKSAGRGGETSGAVRGEPLRQKVLDAAERLLRQGKAEFSMRDLAAEAGVSFATPFNQFGSKAAIMHALSARRIETMEARFAAAPPPRDTAKRLLLAVETAAAVMLEAPAVNRAVMGWLGAPGPEPGEVLARSTALWALALGDGEGLAEERREEALETLPGLLALGFRGVLSFWTAGELPDATLAPKAKAMANALLRGYGSA